MVIHHIDPDEMEISETLVFNPTLTRLIAHEDFSTVKITFTDGRMGGTPA
jgi:hypothetical protein